MKRGVYLCGFDTEDDSAGNPYLFCFVHERGSYSTASRDDALFFLRTLEQEIHEAGDTLQVWATNLEYDLVNLFGVSRLKEVALRFGRSYLCGARWKRIDFRDTVRHLPLSVKALGEMVGLPKLTRDTSTRYCIRDATITYRAAKFFREAYSRHGVTPKLTQASTALSIWKEGFGEITPVDRDVWEFADRCYYGGRTEPFAVGSFGKVRAIDAASMFPWAMTVEPLPLPWGPYSRVRQGGEILKGGIYYAEVVSDLGIPVLPLRTDRGLLFPNGRFRGYWTGDELLYFTGLGGSARVLSGFSFHVSNEPFKAYVSTMFKLKNRSRGPERTLYKYLLNALYGKFGQRGGRIIALPLETLLKRPRLPEGLTLWHGIGFYTVNTDPPPWSNMVWPAFITARARIRLHKEMMRLKEAGAGILYCDTDSVLYTGGPGDYPDKAKKPGDFENRGQFTEALIVGKKEYGLRTGRKWEVHIKGVPKSERETYLKTGRAGYKLPLKIRESVRRGLTPNVWIDRVKERKTDIRKNRKRNRAGFLSPVVV